MRSLGNLGHTHRQTKSSRYGVASQLKNENLNSSNSIGGGEGGGEVGKAGGETGGDGEGG